MRSRATTRTISGDKLIELAESIAEEEEGPLAIGGGVAMHIWGSPRLTGDLDLIAIDNLGFQGEELAFGGVRTSKDNIPVDVIVRTDKWSDLYEEALDNAAEVEGIAVSVITPEYLAAMKMIAGRPKDDEDLRFLVLSDEFDQETAEAIIEEHLGPYAVDDLASVIEEAKWRKTKEHE